MASTRTRRSGRFDPVDHSLLSSAAATWAAATLGHSPERRDLAEVVSPARSPAFIRDDTWRLEDAIEDWVSDASAVAPRPNLPGGGGTGGRRRGGVGPPSVDEGAPTSVSDAQTILHELYLSMANASVASSAISTRHPLQGPALPAQPAASSPPTRATGVEQLAPHVRTRLAAAFEQSAQRAPLEPPRERPEHAGSVPGEAYDATTAAHSDEAYDDMYEHAAARQSMAAAELHRGSRYASWLPPRTPPASASSPIPTPRRHWMRSPAPPSPAHQLPDWQTLRPTTSSAAPGRIFPTGFAPTPLDLQPRASAPFDFHRHMLLSGGHVRGGLEGGAGLGAIGGSLDAHRAEVAHAGIRPPSHAALRPSHPTPDLSISSAVPGRALPALCNPHALPALCNPHALPALCNPHGTALW